MSRDSWTRRGVLGGLCATTLVAPAALAFGDASKVHIAEMSLGAGTASRPLAWRRLLYELESTTSVEVAPQSILLKPDDPRLFDYPFCVVMGDGEFSLPSEEGLEQLGRYLAYGGFLLFDDTSGMDTSPFYSSVRRLTRALFPTRSLTPVPSDHSVYRSFFLLREALGRVNRHPLLEGVTVGNLSPLMVCRNDLSGALERNENGYHPYPCVPGGERQRREAVKLGINLLMYSLTANYKRDQVHVRELILKGRWSE